MEDSKNSNNNKMKSWYKTLKKRVKRGKKNIGEVSEGVEGAPPTPPFDKVYLEPDGTYDRHMDKKSSNKSISSSMLPHLSNDDGQESAGRVWTRRGMILLLSIAAISGGIMYQKNMTMPEYWSWLIDAKTWNSMLVGTQSAVNTSWSWIRAYVSKLGI